MRLRMSAKGGRRRRVEGNDESVSFDKDGQSRSFVAEARLCCAGNYEPRRVALFINDV